MANPYPSLFPALSALAQEGDDVVGLDDADELAGAIDHGEGAQVVLVE